MSDIVRCLIDKRKGVLKNEKDYFKCFVWRFYGVDKCTVYSPTLNTVGDNFFVGIFGNSD